MSSLIYVARDANNNIIGYTTVAPDSASGATEPIQDNDPDVLAYFDKQAKLLDKTLMSDAEKIADAKAAIVAEFQSADPLGRATTIELFRIRNVIRQLANNTPYTPSEYADYLASLSILNQ